MRVNSFLTVVGWIALLLYILACRPSWSPDGSKLLVSYEDPARRQVGAAVVDVETGKARTLFVRSNASDDDWVFAQWAHTGEHAILGFEPDDLLLIPVDSAEPIRLFDLPSTAQWSWRAIPEVNGNLFFGGDAITRMDLATGKIISRDTDRKPLLFAEANSVFYIADIDHDGLEFGAVDQKELTLEPNLLIRKKDVEPLGMDKIVGLFDLDPSGRRLAVTASSQDGTRIILCQDNGIERVLVPKLPTEIYVLGDIEWSLAGDVLYASAFTRSDVEDVTDFSLAEIAVADGATRVTPLARLQEPIMDDDDMPTVFIALSPEGSRIAASTVHFDEDDSILGADRALFLVDLDDPERTVTKIPFPPREP